MARNQRIKRLLFCILSGILLILYLSTLLMPHDCDGLHCPLCQIQRAWEHMVALGLTMTGILANLHSCTNPNNIAIPLGDISPSPVAQKVKITS